MAPEPMGTDGVSWGDDASWDCASWERGRLPRSGPSAPGPWSAAGGTPARFAAAQVREHMVTAGASRPMPRPSASWGVVEDALMASLPRLEARWWERLNCSTNQEEEIMGRVAAEVRFTMDEEGGGPRVEVVMPEKTPTQRENGARWDAAMEEAFGAQRKEIPEALWDGLRNGDGQAAAREGGDGPAVRAGALARVQQTLHDAGRGKVEPEPRGVGAVAEPQQRI